MDNAVINSIKSLAIDMIHEAKSGHPGIVLGSAPIMYALYANHININNQDDKWINRDRFVMSAGHGSALLYATLYMTGFNLTVEDLKKFRKIGSKTPGHPELNVTHGVDMSAGPLGQGFASAVGMALASKIQKSITEFPNTNKFTKKSLIDYKVYVLCSDGDLMEGISTEAASLAGTLNLNNLIVLYDSNNISLDGETKQTLTENIRLKFNALGWNTILVKNGNSVKEINKAIEKAKYASNPTLIEVKTTIGNGSLLQGTNSVHGKPLTDDDIAQLKDSLGVPRNEFYVDENLRNLFKKKVMDRCSYKYSDWARNYKEFQEGNLVKEKESLYWLFGIKSNINLNNINMKLEINPKESLRVSNSKIMNEIIKYIPNMIGGSADLFSSTNVYLNEYGDILKDNYKAKNIWFGVREHAMGAILNGLALCNFKVYGSTFLCFSDYLKPAIRMSCLMNLSVTYIFTHDSIYIGEDGPTHQPIEQLTMLRSTPNLNVYRPCDAKELLGCWNIILNNNNPSALILSRTDVPLLENSNNNMVLKGAYVIEKEREKLDGIIIATGTEVYQAIHMSRDIYNKYKIDLRVVSMPNMNLFELQDEIYKNSVIPKINKIFTMEAGSTLIWYKYATNKNYIFGIDQYGMSGSKDEVSKYLQFDYETIENKIINLMKQI